MSRNDEDMDVEISEKEEEQSSKSKAGDSNNKSSKARKNKSEKSSATSKLETRIAKLEEERDELKDLLLRKAAEFENFKKRTESDFLQRIESANADLIIQLLPVMDDFERLEAADENEDLSGLKEGISLIFKKFSKSIKDSGVEPIQAVGQEFDPEKHDALMQVESEDHDSGVVVDEHLKGYVMNDRVLRPSQVLVSK